MGSLIDYCVFNGYAPGSQKYDPFVGVRFEDGRPRIYFPLGYYKVADAISEGDLRQGFFNLISVLSDRSLTENLQGNLLPEDGDDALKFPMYAYMEVLRNFLDFGYYNEVEVAYRVGTSGKINWNRTIKTVRPQVVNAQSANPSVVYFDFVTRHNDYKADNLISLINKFCVHDAVTKVGALFGIGYAEEPELSFDYNLFAEVLQDKISKTFNDVHLNLFNAMLQIVEYLADREVHGDGDSVRYTYGVNSFAPVWENMIERIFGTERREDYYPNCIWKIDGREADRVEMRPDTIMVVDDDLFVLDSKYYTYGVDYGSLPQSESITKQFAYAEYAERKSGKTVYNVFLMPYRSNVPGHSLTETDPQTHSPLMMKYLGYAYGDWKNTDPNAGLVKSYHKIHGILLDIKTVMQSYNKERAAQKVLANLVLSEN